MKNPGKKADKSEVPFVQIHKCDIYLTKNEYTKNGKYVIDVCYCR